MLRTSVSQALRGFALVQKTAVSECPSLLQNSCSAQPSAVELFGLSRLQPASAAVPSRCFATVVPDAEKDAAKARAAEAESPAQDGGSAAHPRASGVDPAAASQQPQSGAEDLQTKIAELDQHLLEKESQIEEEKDRVLRALADLENLRDRSARQAETTRKFAVQGFAKSLLDVADNLERALETVDKPATGARAADKLKTLTDGLKLTDKILIQAFKQNGLERYEAHGEKFDPNLHEALFEVPDPSKPAGTVGIVTKPGYKLHGRVLRPAEVGVVQADAGSSAASE